MDQHQAVVYNGPWQQVCRRRWSRAKAREVRTTNGVRKRRLTFTTVQPYAEQITPIAPSNPVLEADAVEIDCHENLVRRSTTDEGSRLSENATPRRRLLRDQRVLLTQFPQFGDPTTMDPFGDENVPLGIKTGVVGMDEFPIYP